MSSICDSGEIYGMVSNYLSLVEYLHPIAEENHAIIADSVRSQSMALYFTAKKINTFMSDWRPEDLLSRRIQMLWRIFFQFLDKTDGNEKIVWVLQQLQSGLNQKSISSPDNPSLLEFFENTGLQIVPAEKEITNQTEIRNVELEPMWELFNEFLSFCLFESDSAIRENFIKDLRMLIGRKSGRALIEKLVKSMKKNKVEKLHIIKSDSFYFVKSPEGCYCLLYLTKLQKTKIFNISNSSEPFLISLYDPFNFVNLSHELTHMLNDMENHKEYVLRKNSPPLNPGYTNREEEITILVENLIIRSFHLPERKFHYEGTDPNADTESTSLVIDRFNLSGDRARLMHEAFGKITDPQLFYEASSIMTSSQIPYIPPLRLPKVLEN